MNIIFDGNYLFHKTLGVFKSAKEGELKQDLNMTELFKEKEHQAQFFRKLIIDFCNTVRIFENVDKVLFVFDSPSWRKEKYSWYKSKGEKDELQLMLESEEKEGWDAFYKIMDKMVLHLTSKGFPVSKTLNFEGDDLCYFFGKHYSSKKEKTVIISGDKDLLQFLDEYICVYRNNSLAPAFFCIDDSFLLQVGETILKKYKKTKIEIVDPEKHTFLKMLAGDKGDNVNNLFSGLGPKTAEGFFEKMKSIGLEKPNFNDLDYLTKLCNIIAEGSKKAPTVDELQINLLTNVDVMWLNEAVYTETQLKVAEKEVLQKAYDFSFKGEFTLTDILTK